MDWLNYHHLFYFWTVAREGSIAKASARLRLTEPTVSAQVHALEEALGEVLFRRTRRGMVLTDGGRLALRYADQIFTLGQEFQSTIRGLASRRTLHFNVGIADVVPRLISFLLLEPAVRAPNPFVVATQTDTADGLVAKLATHQVDAVISDAPLDQSGTSGTHNVLLGESGATVFGVAALAKSLRRKFPASLDGAPFLLPAADTTMAASLERWFAQARIRPNVRGQFTDSALLKTFGRAGIGVFVAPTAIERAVRREYGVSVIGRIDSIRERFYIASASRKMDHPALGVVVQAARQRLFGGAARHRPA